MSEYLTTNQLAAKLQVNPMTVNRWVKDGRIPAIQITPRTFRYELASVLKALETPVSKENVT